MNNKLALILATSKNYIQTLQSEQGRRVVSVMFIMLALSMFVIGRWSSPTPVLMQQTMAEMRLEMLQQQEMLGQLSREHETNINALAARLAELQAASTRLDALGERLVQLGQLDPEEFNFNQLAPMGGPENIISDGHSNASGEECNTPTHACKVRRPPVNISSPGSQYNQDTVCS